MRLLIFLYIQFCAHIVGVYVCTLLCTQDVFVIYLPVCRMPSYKLYYFDFDGGAGEPIRNLFRLCKIPFEDIRVKHSDWPAIKGKAVFGQMPLLEIDGQMYAQSMALLRYLGKITGMYPTDAILALQVDELMDCMLDVRGKMSTTYAMGEAEKLSTRIKLAEEFIKPRLADIEKRIANSVQIGGFAVGGKMTIADLVLANDVTGYMSGRLDGIEKTIADSHVNLLKVCTNVQETLHKKE